MSHRGMGGYAADEQVRLAYQESLLTQAVRQLRDEEIGELERMGEGKNPQSPQMQRRIRQEASRYAVRRVFERHIPQTCAAVILVFALLSLGLTTAFAVSGTFRAAVYELFVEEHEEFTIVEVRRNEQKNVEIPENWGGDYFPGYIPEGYVLNDIGHAFEHSYWVEYRNADDEWISFDEDDQYVSASIDTENADVWYQSVNGEQAIVSVKDQYVIVVWRQHDKMLTVMKQGDDVQTTLAVAESVSRVR